MAARIMIPVKDKYDVAIEYLCKHPREIRKAWGNPDKHTEGCLFQFAEKNSDEIESECGCLTMIRSHKFAVVVGRPDLTKEIRNDDRIPNGPSGITTDNLHVFAEWQRRLDKELQRA